MSTPRVSCPTCKRQLDWSEQFPFRPFCSERCRMVDLGAWFAEERRIADDSPPSEPSEPALPDAGRERAE